MPPRISYALFMLLALVVFLFARRLIPCPPGLARLPWQQRLALMLAGFVGGALGAKVPFALGVTEGFLTLEAWLTDGKTITTGLIGAYLGVELCKLCLGMDVKTGDTFALPLALALAVGRWGCFCHGCCFGQPTELPWGVVFPQIDQQPRHPTQVYESLFHVVTACLLVMLLRQRWLRWQHLKLYLISYGLFRFLTEYLRPEPIWWAGLTFYQWVSLGLIIGLSLQWWIDEVRKQREERGQNLCVEAGLCGQSTLSEAQAGSST